MTSLRTTLPAALGLINLAACSTPATNEAAGPDQGGAAPGTTTTATSSSSTSAIAFDAGGFGGAGATTGCDAPAGSFYELSAEQYGALDPVSMCKYRGDVALIVNTAAL